MSKVGMALSERYWRGVSKENGGLWHRMGCGRDLPLLVAVVQEAPVEGPGPWLVTPDPGREYAEWPR